MVSSGHDECKLTHYVLLHKSAGRIPETPPETCRSVVRRYNADMVDESEALVTIGDLVGEPTLDMTAVVVPAGSAASRVSWVHATEQLDPRPHLRRHELVCTLGSALVRPGAAETFASAVAAAGVAAIALGLGEVHLEPPRELVESCRRLNVPLLALPHGVPFLAVNDAVLRKRSRIAGETRKKETALLARLMSMARTGATEDALLAEVSATLGGKVQRSPRGSRAAGGVPEWVGEGPGPSQEFMDQLESLLEFSGIEQARESSETQIRLGQLIELIAGGLAHPAAILPELDARGIDQSRLRVSSWPSGSEGALAHRWAAGLIGTVSRGVVLISGPETEESFRDLGLVCGYSAIVAVTDLRRALRESASALRLARSRGGVAGPEQLVSLDALLEQQPADALNPFIEQLLAPIITADKEGRGDLMQTLAVFIEHDRQLQATAAHLYVHVNTVRHRLTRILELSGRDPLTLSGITDLKIALWAAERRRAVDHRLIRPLHE